MACIWSAKLIAMACSALISSDTPVSRQRAGHRVSVQLDAQDCCLHVFLQERRVKSLPVRGLLGQVLSFEQFLAPMLQQARAQHRLRSLQERRYRTAF